MNNYNISILNHRRELKFQVISNTGVLNVFYGKHLKRKLLAMVPAGKRRHKLKLVIEKTNNHILQTYLVGNNKNAVKLYLKRKEVENNEINR